MSYERRCCNLCDDVTNLRKLEKKASIEAMMAPNLNMIKPPKKKDYWQIIR